MSLLKRIHRLITADMHQVLDHMEDPASILRQSIREMEEVLTSNNKSIKEINSQLERGSQKLTEQQDQIQILTEQMNLCFSESNETLAKALLRKKMLLELNCKQLHKHAHEKRKLLGEIQNEIAEQERSVEEVRCNLEIIERHNLSQPLSRAMEEMNISEAQLEIAFVEAKKSWNTQANGRSSNERA